MTNELTKVEFKSLSGLQVTLDAETVKNTLTRGDGKVTDQEVAMFLRTCQAKSLDPLENGEVYLIKYSDKAPAQLVVGCHAYIRRADHFPDYRGYKAGITVARITSKGIVEVIQKEGCCVYKSLGEELIGGWCRVYRERTPGNTEETFVEVSLEEYSSGKSNWNDKPATMIVKVAKSQAFRGAFPNEYEGLYTIDEMTASGAIPENYSVNEVTGEVVEVEAEPVVTHEQRQKLFAAVSEIYPPPENQEVLKAMVQAEGYSSTKDLPESVYKTIMAKIEEIKKSLEQMPAESEG